MESYRSEWEYLQALQARSALPEGFRAAAVSLRFFPRERRVSEPLPMNLSLILLDRETSDFGAMFTRNKFPGSAVLIGRERLGIPAVRGVLINNKIANVCAPGGREDAVSLLAALGRIVGVPAESLFIASTGIIGWRLPVREMEGALPGLAEALSKDSILPMARAIMTTDSFPKVRRARAGGGSILGIAKGAGMIEPNMATMLCFLCTDVAVERERLRGDLAWCVERSLNRISVDGDQSTSDTVLLFSSGRKGPADPEEFRRALLEVLSGLAEDIVRNAEGAAHVMRVRVHGARSEAVARGAAKCIVNSPLVKTAVFGNDPNVGRIVSALGDFLGNEELPFEPGLAAIRMGGMEIFSSGIFRLDAQKEESLSAYLEKAAFDPKIKGYPQHDGIVEIEIDLGAKGESASAEALGTDLSYEYVRENADYRS